MPNWRHSTAIFSPSSSRATNLSRSSIGLHSLQGTFALLAKGPVCNPCLRNELSPFSQEGHKCDQTIETHPGRQARGPAAELGVTVANSVPLAFANTLNERPQDSCDEP